MENCSEIAESFVYYAATVKVSLFAGILALVLLYRRGYHVDDGGSIRAARIVSVFIQSCACYTFLVLVFGHFFLDEKLSRIIASGFSDERIAWLLLTVLLETSVRVVGEFRHSV